MKRVLFAGLSLVLILAVVGFSAAFAGPGVGKDPDVEEFVNPPKPKPVEEKTETQPGTEEPEAGEEEEEEIVRILDPEQLLPLDCPLFASVPRIARLVDGLEQTAMSKLFAERELADFWGKIAQKKPGGTGREAGEAGLQQVMERAGFGLDKIKNIFAKKAVFAVLPGTGNFRACAVFAVDDEVERAQELVSRLMSELKRAYPTTVEDSYWDGDIEVRTLDTQWGKISVLFADNLLAIGYGDDALDSAVENCSTEDAKSFADSPDYKKLYAQIGKGAEFYFQADMPALMKKLEAAVASDDVKLGPEMLSGVGLIAGASKIDGGGIRDTMVFLPAPDAAEFMPQASRDKADFTRAASYIPLNAILFIAQQQDFSKIAETVRQQTATMTKLEAAQFMAGLDFVKEQTKVDILKDLHPAFGGQTVMAALRTPGQMAPEFVMVIGVNDVPAAKNTVQKLADATKQKFQEVDNYYDHKIRYLELDETKDSAKPGQRGMKFSPAYAFSPDFLIVASSLETIKKAIRQKRFGRISVMQKDDFKRVTEGFDVQKSAVGYLDLGQTVELIYSAAMPFVAVAAQSGQLGFTTADVPSAETITKHLFGIAYFMKVDDDKAEFQSYGPVGIVSAVGLGASFGVPMLMRHQAEKAREESKNKLRVVGMGLHLFASDNGRFPQSLSDLFPMYVQKLSVFEPSRGSTIESVDDIESKGAYVYVPGRKRNDLSESVLVFEKPDVSSGGRHVLRLDMNVRYYKTKAFERLFKDLVKRERGDTE